MPKNNPLSLLAATAPDCLICTDRAGLVLEFNRAAEAAFGWRREEVLGQRVFELIIPPPVRDLHPMMLSAYRPGKSSKVVGQRQELPVLRRDGSQFTVELVLSTLTVDETLVFVAHLRDISAALEAERATALALSRAEARGRSQAGFVAAMSHEMRMPLATLAGSLQMLSEAAAPRDERRLVRAAHESATLLTQLLDDVLDFVGLESGEVSVEAAGFAPRGLLDGVVHLLAPQARQQQATLVAELDPALPERLVMDGNRLRQVTVGLVAMALRFAPTGEVRLRLRAAEPGWLRLEVADPGLGFARERQAVLAMALEADDEARVPDAGFGGGALRIALCQRLIRAMGGRFLATSTALDGFVSIAELPWRPDESLLANSSKPAGEDTQMPVGRAPPSSVRHRRSLQVLLAEDSQSNRLVLAELLRRRGCEVDLAVNGLDAVDAVQRQLPDLVLMDIDMPELDGVSALRALRQLGGAIARLPVVAMTAHATPGARREFLSIGFDDYLAKPVDADQLMSTLGRWMPSGATLPAAGDLSATTAQPVVPAAAEPKPDELAVPASAVLEPGALRRLAREVGQARLPRMLKIFCDELERRAGLLQVALDERDLAAIARESHVLKGSATTFGAHGLQHEAQATNEACRRNEPEAAFAGVSRLLHLVPPTLAALRAQAMEA